tara:strand:- start:1629 stop:2294 length:666 start_codon:yes stop_codon:yes gene_type:complete
MSKLNLEIDRLDSSLGLKEGMSAVENSLSRTERIISDIDKRISNLNVSSDTIFWEKKSPGSDVTSFASDTAIIDFNNLQLATYRWSLVCYFFIDGNDGGWSAGLDTDFIVKLYNSSDVYTSKEWEVQWRWNTNNNLIDITDDSSPVTDGTFTYNNEGPLSEIYGTVSASGIFVNPNLNGKLKFIVDEDSSYDHRIYGDADETYLILEQLPNHKLVTDGRWD